MVFCYHSMGYLDYSPLLTETDRHIMYSTRELWALHVIVDFVVSIHDGRNMRVDKHSCITLPWTRISGIRIGPIYSVWLDNPVSDFTTTPHSTTHLLRFR